MLDSGNRLFALRYFAVKAFVSLWRGGISAESISHWFVQQAEPVMRRGMSFEYQCQRLIMCVAGFEHLQHCGQEESGAQASGNG